MRECVGGLPRRATTLPRLQWRSPSSGMNSMKRMISARWRANAAKSSISSSFMPRTKTEFTLAGPDRPAHAPRRAAASRTKKTWCGNLRKRSAIQANQSCIDALQARGHQAVEPSRELMTVGGHGNFFHAHRSADEK